MSKQSELQLKVQQTIDILGHPDYGKIVYIFTLEELANYIIEIIKKDQFPDTEADGFVFCGKCGKKKEI
jgi:hypothetical protein